MPNKMLIDASHPEETRVVVVRGNRIEEFDFESQDKKQLKGNIYLARVTRVEPSLQAAFIEYGGNRHGFLAFSEIHPDYYQIPVADRQALLRAEAEEAEEEEDEERNGEERSRGSRRRRRGGRSRDHSGDAPQQSGGTQDETQPYLSGGEVEAESVESPAGAASLEDATPSEAAGRQEEAPGPELSADEPGEAAAREDDGDERGRSMAVAVEADVVSEALDRSSEEDDGAAPGNPIAAAMEADVVSEPLEDDSAEDDDDEPGSPIAVENDVVPEPLEDATEAGVGRGMIEEIPAAGRDDQEIESVGAEDALEEVRNRRKPVRRHYKIQEVVKRRQIMLVQVVKEERGNKGAALTTYLSLAGRYSVLMPNTARGGGISRKITNAQDRKRLKEVVQDLEVPQGMGVILRTAGESRTKAEIKRDYEYLMRLWENVRNLTLHSIAPALVYEEGSLIKRSVRDLYNKDIDEILVSGEEGYREAKDFMRMLMPSHAKVVQPYRESTPIFVRWGVEAQLDRILQPQVTLKSGGYIIINQTEALVAIDVNSGRSTREHSIEETALHTNLEAAEEIARQLRLRDLAGLIVIDFIDMEESRNNRAVEKRLKDHLKNDRARIQVGRISHFGLMEMSRQRIRASVLESTMKPCPVCGGTGHVRSESSVALLVVRAIEEFLLKDSRSNISVRTPTATALYVLNHKRSTLVELENRFGLSIAVEADDAVGSQHYQIVRGALVERPLAVPQVVAAPAAYMSEEAEPDVAEAEEELADSTPGEATEQHEAGPGEEGHRDRKRRRRRRRRGGREREAEESQEADVRAFALEAPEAIADLGEAPEQLPEAAGEPEPGEDDTQARKHRRGKRGGKRNRKDGEAGLAAETGFEAKTAEAMPEETIGGWTTEPAPAVSKQAASAPGDADAVEPEPSERPRKAPRRSRSRRTAAAAPGQAPEEQGAYEAEPVEAEPVEAEPVEAEPVEAEPVEAEPVEAEPVAATRAREPAVEPRPLEPAAAGETPSRDRRRNDAEVVTASSVPQAEDESPKKTGWWKRRSFF